MDIHGNECPMPISIDRVKVSKEGDIFCETMINASQLSCEEDGMVLFDNIQVISNEGKIVASLVADDDDFEIDFYEQESPIAILSVNFSTEHPRAIQKKSPSDPKDSFIYAQFDEQGNSFFKALEKIEKNNEQLKTFLQTEIRLKQLKKLVTNTNNCQKLFSKDTFLYSLIHSEKACKLLENVIQPYYHSIDTTISNSGSLFSYLHESLRTKTIRGNVYFLARNTWIGNVKIFSTLPGNKEIAYISTQAAAHMPIEKVLLRGIDIQLFAGGHVNCHVFTAK